jgi:hypothetical protein
MTTKKKPLTSDTAFSDSEYSEFVQSLELFCLALKSCHAEVDRAAYFAMPHQVKMFTHKYRMTDLAAKHFDAEGDFEVSIAASEDAAPAVKINCVFQVHIHAGSQIKPEHAERFTGSELRLILVPHARQFAFMVSGQMSIPPLMLPLTTRVSGQTKAKKKKMIK